MTRMDRQAEGFDGSEANAAVASSALALDGSSDADKEARKHAAIRISRRLAIVPAAVRGDALLGRTSGRSPPPRTPAVTKSAVKERWCCDRWHQRAIN